jgi:diaminohydroxyphosphoribosylaminopyrimidine deaminase / 5-amino-6-(5-phosphoribosylamino)uracil reductase
MNDTYWMKRALVLARRGWGTTLPNPIVGAVVLDRNGAVVGTGYHRKAGGPHAEVFALDEAGERARGGTIYVTLEPCCGFQGKRTGSCSDRIVSSGLKRVVVATLDPNRPVNGKGVARLREAGIEVSVGCLDGISELLNLPFRTFVTENRPFIVAKAALSLDGKIGIRGKRVLLTGSAAMRRTMYLRAGSGAILVGAETIRSDDPYLTVRGKRSDRKPVRAVLDPDLKTPPSARILNSDGGPVWIFTATKWKNTQEMETLQARGARGVFLDLRDDGLFEIRDLLPFFAAEKITSLLLEGGAQTISSFAAAGLIDRWIFFVAPRLLGKRLQEIPTVPLDLPPGVALKIGSVIRRGADWQVVAESEKN